MLWLPRHPFDEPDAVTQVAMYDLRESREMRAYNALLRHDGHTLRIIDTDYKHVAEKVSFDKNGLELDRIPEKYYAVVTYRHRPGASIPAALALPDEDDE